MMRPRDKLEAAHVAFFADFRSKMDWMATETRELKSAVSRPPLSSANGGYARSILERELTSTVGELQVRTRKLVQQVNVAPASRLLDEALALYERNEAAMTRLEDALEPYGYERLPPAEPLPSLLPAEPSTPADSEGEARADAAGEVAVSTACLAAGADVASHPPPPGGKSPAPVSAAASRTPPPPPTPPGASIRGVEDENLPPSPEFPSLESMGLSHYSRPAVADRAEPAASVPPAPSPGASARTPARPSTAGPPSSSAAKRGSERSLLAPTSSSAARRLASGRVQDSASARGHARTGAASAVRGASRSPLPSTPKASPSPRGSSLRSRSGLTSAGGGAASPRTSALSASRPATAGSARSGGSAARSSAAAPGSGAAARTGASAARSAAMTTRPSPASSKQSPASVAPRTTSLKPAPAQPEPPSLELDAGLGALSELGADLSFSPPRTVAVLDGLPPGVAPPPRAGPAAAPASAAASGVRRSPLASQPSAPTPPPAAPPAWALAPLSEAEHGAAPSFLRSQFELGALNAHLAQLSRALSARIAGSSDVDAAVVCTSEEIASATALNPLHVDAADAADGRPAKSVKALILFLTHSGRALAERRGTTTCYRLAVSATAQG